MVSNGGNVVPSTIWGILTTKTVYLTLLAFFIFHPASHGKSGRCVTLRQIKYAQMFLHHFVCSVHFPTVQKYTGIETIPHFYWKNDKGVEPANGIQPAFSGDFVTEEHPTQNKWIHKLPNIRLISIINILGFCFFCPINHVASVFSREINVPGQEKTFFDHFLKSALVSSSSILLYFFFCPSGDK